MSNQDLQTLGDLSYFDSYLDRQTSDLHIWAFDDQMVLRYFKDHWKPSLYVRAPSPDSPLVNTPLKSLEGHSLIKIQYDRLFGMTEELKNLTENEKLHVKENGFVPPEIPRIAELFPKKPDLLIRPKRLYFDIEVFSETGFPSPEKATWPITACTFFRAWENKMICYGIKPLTPEEIKELPDDTEFNHCEDEITLIAYILAELAQGHTISGWNSNQYDIPYIHRRCEVLRAVASSKKHKHYKILAAGLSVVSNIGFVSVYKKYDSKEARNKWFIKIPGKGLLDLLDLYKKFTRISLSSYSLDNVGKFEFGEGKLKAYGGGGNKELSLVTMYKNHWSTYIAYNIRDVRLTVDIDAKRALTELSCEFCSLAGIPVDRVVYMSAILDGALVKFLRDRNYVAPGHFVNPSLDKIKGGFVKKPIAVWGRRFYQHTTAIDVTSSYPTAMVVLNMSPETFVGRLDMEDVFYYQVPPGDDGAKTLLNRNAALTLDVMDLLPTEGSIMIRTKPRIFTAEELAADEESKDDDDDTVEASSEEEAPVEGEEVQIEIPKGSELLYDIDDNNSFLMDVAEIRANLENGKWNISGDGTIHLNQSETGNQGVFASFIESGFATRKALKVKYQKHRDLYEDNKKEEDKALMDSYNTGQLGWKLLLNSSYGQLASRYNRLYNPLTAQGITSTGQAVVLSAERWVNVFFQEIYKLHLPALKEILAKHNKSDLPIPFWDASVSDRVVTMDTDSALFTLDDMVDTVFPDGKGDYVELIKDVTEIVVSSLNTFMNTEFKKKRLRSNSKFSIAFEHEAEKISNGAMYLAKKKYILRTANGKLKITGFELKKVNMSEGIRKELEELVNYLLDHGKKLDMSTAMTDFLNRAKKLHSILSEGTPQQVANRLSYSVAVNNLEKYADDGKGIFGKGAPIHVKGALIHNRLLKECGSTVPEIFSGERVKCLKIKAPLPKWSSVCFKEELPAELCSLKPDVAQIIQVDFIQKGQKLLGAFGWESILTNLLKYLNKKPTKKNTTIVDRRDWMEDPTLFTVEEIEVFIKSSLGI